MKPFATFLASALLSLSALAQNFPANPAELDTFEDYIFENGQWRRVIPEPAANLDNDPTNEIQLLTIDETDPQAPIIALSKSGGSVTVNIPSEGLRGAPVADNAALTALDAKDYERRLVEADGKEYVFELGAVSGTLADDLTTGFWQEQVVSVGPFGGITTNDAGVSFNDPAGTPAFRSTLTPNSQGARAVFSIDSGNVTNVGIVNNPTGTPAAGDTFVIDITTAGTHASGEFQIEWGDGYFDQSGAPMGTTSYPDNHADVLVFQSVTLLAGQTTWNGHPVTAANGRIYREITSSGAILPSGDLVSTPIDSSVGATTETLAASTALGVVRLFTNEDVSNTATLAVQSGETLNGVTDGTFLFSNYSAGTQFRADEVTGGWVVSVVGASVDGESVSSLMDLSDITATGTSLVQGIVAATNQTALHNDGTATMTRLGDKAFCTLRITIDDDDVTTLILGTSIVPTGGEILSLAVNGLHRWQNASMVVSSDGNVITWNRSDDIDSDVTFELTFITSGWTEKNPQVLAGMVAVEDASVEGLFDAGIAATFGIYEFRMNPAGGNRHFEMRVNTGTQAITGFASYDSAQFNVAGETANANRSITLDTNWTTVWIDGTLDWNSIGQTEGLVWNDGTENYKFTGKVGVSYNNNFIEIKRLGQKTVINTKDVPVANTGAQVGDLLEWTGTQYVPSPLNREQDLGSTTGTVAVDASAGRIVFGAMDTADVTLDPVTNLDRGTVLMRLTASGAARNIDFAATIKRPSALSLPLTVPAGQSAIVTITSINSVQTANIQLEAL